MQKTVFSVMISLFVFSGSHTAIGGEICADWIAGKHKSSYWNWDTSDGSIDVVPCDKGKCLRIERKSKGRTFITKKITAPHEGSYGFKAVIKSTDIQPGTKRFERGKFQVRLYDAWTRNLSEARNYYPSSDFNTMPDWQTLMFTADDVKKGEVMEVRIGLQEAAGTIYVSQFEHCMLK